MSDAQVTVRIFGESYPLRTEEDPAYVERVARHVDARMREIASAGKVVVTSKLAVLAALHIADELFRLRRETERERGERERRIGELVAILDRSLDGASAP